MVNQANLIPSQPVLSRLNPILHHHPDQHHFDQGVGNQSPDFSRPVDRLTLGELPAITGLSKEEIYHILDQALSKAHLAPLSELAPTQLKALAHDIPKVDLHRHLEGSISPETLIKVAKKHHVPLPTYEVEKLRPLIQITPEDMQAGEEDGLKVFLSKFALIGKIFTSPAVIEDLTYHVAKECHDDNIRYSELRFSPFYMATGTGKKPEEITAEDLSQVTEAVIRGAEKASRELGDPIGLIIICERQMGQEAAWAVEKIAEKYQKQGVVALDLANNEYDFPPGPYKNVFQAAKKAGLKITVHAGEVPVRHDDPTVGGANNVRVALNELKADRIGHGVKTYEDPQLEHQVIQKHIPLEICPTSNVQTQAVPSMQEHPLYRYHREGAVVTINTDDPGVSGITLSDDFATITKTFGFTLQDLKRFVDNGVQAAFVDDTTRSELQARVNREFKQAENKLFDSLTIKQLKELALAGTDDPKEKNCIRNEFSRLNEWLTPYRFTVPKVEPEATLSNPANTSSVL